MSDEDRMWKHLCRKYKANTKKNADGQYASGTDTLRVWSVGPNAILHRVSVRVKKNAWIGFLLPSFLGVSIFVLLPFLDVIRRSFTTAVTGEFTGLSNYRRILETPAFVLAVKNTLRFTLICIPLLIVLGLVTALLLSRLKHIQLIKSLLLFPMAVPAAAVVLIWKMIFYKQGFLNAFLLKISEILSLGWSFTGSTAPDYMGSDKAFWVLVFSYIWKNLGYTVILWLAGILSISTDIIEAAKVDGAGEAKCFFYIILPNLKGFMYTITVLSFLNSFKVFREAYLVAGSYPDKSMYLLQHLFNNWYVNLDLDKMAAAAVLVGMVLFVFILLLQRLWDEKEEGNPRKLRQKQGNLGELVRRKSEKATPGKQYTTKV